MQPTLPSAGAADMDLPAVQSMDWLFKKERIYLLAQFWQQRATLAEKEVTTLKEQLSTASIASPKHHQQNGIPPSLASPMSDCSSNNIPPSGCKQLLNNNKLMDTSLDMLIDQTAAASITAGLTPQTPTSTATTNHLSNYSKLLDEMGSQSETQNNNNSNNNLNNSTNSNNSSNSNRSSPIDQEMCGVPVTTTSSMAVSLSDTMTTASTTITAATTTINATTIPLTLNGGDRLSVNNNNSCSDSSLNINVSGSKTVGDEIAAKNREILALIEEVTRLRNALTALQDAHNNQIQRLEDRLDAKQLHITRLETRLDKQSDYDDVKKESSTLRAIDVSPSDSKQFQELLLERTKALAAQTDAFKSANNSDGSSTSVPAKHDQSKHQPLNTPTSRPTTPISDTPRASTPVSNVSVGSTKQATEPKPSKSPIPPQLPSALAAATTPAPLSLSSALQTVESFGTFLGEEIVSNWRRGLELPPPPPGLSSLRTSMQSMHLNQHHFHSNHLNYNHHYHRMTTSSSPQTDEHQSTGHLSNNQSQQHLSHTPTLLHHHSQQSHHNLPSSGTTHTSRRDLSMLDDKSSSHHDASSSASTPILQDSRSDDTYNNGGGITPMSMPMSKSPHEDNNNHLGALSHVSIGASGNTPTFPMGLPFQFQERGHFRFAEDLQLPPGSLAGRLGDSLIPKGDPMEAKLQEMLRYNMDKYANQNLDTLHISRRVRELLSVHNIGQRLFAKYVLGLSQGTVSELLSKPKPWDKLTEKGRDSYRKMHAWACDDNAVLLLKSLIPKKDKLDSGMPSFGRGDDGMPDERIAHILTEASSMIKPSSHPSANHPLHHSQPPFNPQHLMGSSHHASLLSQSAQQNDDSPSNDEDDSKSPHRNTCDSPFSKDSRDTRRQRKYDSDDMPHDKVTRIYQEELAKLMARVPARDTFPNFLFPHFLGGAGGPPAGVNSASGIPPLSQMPDDNIRMAFEAYHRELAKLQQNSGNVPNFPNLPGIFALQQQALNGAAQDLSVKKESAASKLNGQTSTAVPLSLDEQSKDGNTMNSDDPKHGISAFNMVRPKLESTPNTNASSAAPSPLGNSILPPAMTPTDDFSSAASPLQRMASITNSLITQSPVSNHHNSPQRPLKAVLPPITQQQFDMFNNLNTEDIVRRVKEALSQYSISQRLFGESVLGLSQGSVSDLLARPKPWHMLTQKGREPFIRMKMFLEDDNAVHKLVASQYKIAPEKLMRTGNYSGSPQIPQNMAMNPTQMPPMQKMMNEMSKLKQEQHLMHLQQMQHHAQSQQHPSMLLTPPGIPPHHRITLPSPIEEKKPMSMPVHSPQQNNAMRSGMHQHMSPTVYEMAALTQDLDTQIITTKIKESLLANNIGQKIFGEAVLGLSQGSVSELLSKPKPWHMLSIKGREPFIRMQLWLADANNVDRLQALKNERREANKRRRSTGPGVQDNSSDTSSNDTSEFYTSNSPGPASVGSAGAPPNKKQRVLFSEEQKEALRLAFALDPYPNVATIEFLATELGLSTRTITNWFHNHRMRLKQQVPHGVNTEPVPSRDNQTGAPFDPVQFRILLNQRLVELQKERMGLAGVHIPYPPYFAANPNLAALIGRGLLPTNEAELSALNNAFKEQLSGLDLTMGSLKRERDYDERDFDDLDGDADESHNISDGEDDDIVESASGNVSGIDSGLDMDKAEALMKDPETIAAMMANALSRTSRRKPVAPQWVNPVWHLDDKKCLAPPPPSTGMKSADEVIINGVCVMQQAADFNRLDETVRIEPQAVHDRFGEGDRSEEGIDGSKSPKDDDARAASSRESDENRLEKLDIDLIDAIRGADDGVLKPESIKKELPDSDRWDY